MGDQKPVDLTASIIIPAYNAAAFLAEAIESALAQSQPASQIIVVDDGSKDATAKAAEQFGDAVILLRQANAGVSTARNYGAAQTSADWLLFLDADDRLRPDALRMLLSRASEASLGCIYGQSVDFTNGSPSGDRFGKEHGSCAMQGAVPIGARVAFWKAPIATPGAAIVRRDVLERVGGWNPQFNTTADRDLWCRIGTVAEFGFVHEIVVERRVHDSNMSSDKNRGRRQAVEVQLGFLEWCSARGVDTAFLETSEAEIFERNASRAIEERAFDAAMWIANEAELRGIQSTAISRARRLAGMTGLARDMEIRVREFIGL
jgi:glycosyltransferase involved in cell wall biosynthesis